MVDFYYCHWTLIAVSNGRTSALKPKIQAYLFQDFSFQSSKTLHCQKKRASFYGLIQSCLKGDLGSKATLVYPNTTTNQTRNPKSSVAKLPNNVDVEPILLVQSESQAIAELEAVRGSEVTPPFSEFHLRLSLVIHEHRYSDLSQHGRLFRRFNPDFGLNLGSEFIHEFLGHCLQSTSGENNKLEKLWPSCSCSSSAKTELHIHEFQAKLFPEFPTEPPPRKY